MSDQNEFLTDFSVNFFTDFSKSFSGNDISAYKPYEPTEQKFIDPSSYKMPDDTDEIIRKEWDKIPSEPEAKEPSFEDEYKKFIKSDKFKKLHNDLQNMERMNEDWNKKYKNKEEEEIIKQHKAKYKEFIDEYEEERKNSTIEYIPSSISKYPRVDTAFDLLYRGIDRNTEEIAKSIGCVIRGQTLYPIDWSKEEVEELNRRLKR